MYCFFFLAEKTLAHSCSESTKFNYHCFRKSSLNFVSFLHALKMVPSSYKVLLIARKTYCCYFISNKLFLVSNTKQSQFRTSDVIGAIWSSNVAYEMDSIIIVMPFTYEVFGKQLWVRLMGHKISTFYSVMKCLHLFWHEHQRCIFCRLWFLVKLITDNAVVHPPKGTLLIWFSVLQFYDQLSNHFVFLWCV